MNTIQKWILSVSVATALMAVALALVALFAPISARVGSAAPQTVECVVAAPAAEIVPLGERQPGKAFPQPAAHRLYRAVDEPKVHRGD